LEYGGAVQNRTTPILGAYSLLNKIKPLNQPLKINLTLLKVIYGGDKYIIVFQLLELSTYKKALGLLFTSRIP